MIDPYKQFIGGDEEPMYIDIHCYPPLEMMMLLNQSPFDKNFDALELHLSMPATHDFVSRFRERMQWHVVNRVWTNNYLRDWMTKPPGVKPAFSLDHLTELKGSEMNPEYAEGI